MYLGLYSNGFFSSKKYIFIQSKKMCSMKFFYSMILGSKIWSSICRWNSVKLLHVLYSDFDACVNHKSKPHLTVLTFKFVFGLRGLKCTFTGSGFVVDLIIPLHQSNLGFFLAAWKVTDHTTIIFTQSYA